MFPRSKYYSQTQALKLFKINIKQFKHLIQENNIHVLSKDIDLGTFSVKTVYILKEDIDKLNLEPRQKNLV